MSTVILPFFLAETKVNAAARKAAGVLPSLSQSPFVFACPFEAIYMRSSDRGACVISVTHRVSSALDADHVSLVLC
jgi:hypothetical protein